MSLTADDVAEIIRLLDASSFDELRLELPDLKLVLRRGGAPSIEEPRPAERTGAAAAPPVVLAPAPAAPAEANGLAGITAPLLGVFFRAPKPGAAPFVEVGSAVEPDTVIGIIEVMKLMNPVRAGHAGEIVEILAENAVLVEYGQVLMRVRSRG